MGDVLPSSLRLFPRSGRFTARVPSTPQTHLGGPRDTKPGAGRPRPPRGQARVAVRLATPMPAGRLTSLAHYGDVDPVHRRQWRKSVRVRRGPATVTGERPSR